MNWFTKGFVGLKSAEAKARHVQEADNVCEHVEKDSSLLFCISRENDPWGSESYCMCEKCYDGIIEEEDNESHECIDCHKVFKLKDGKLWKWYDFHAPSGEEPLPICKECLSKPTHINRVKQDRRDHDEEMDAYGESWDDND